MVAAGGFGQRGTQRQAQTQVQALSQGQRQSLALLAMSLPELRAELFRQMEQNVVIDEIEPTLERETISQKEDESDAEEREFASDYTEDDDRPETAYTADEDALERRQRFFDSQTREETLEEHLLNQLAMSDLDEKDIPLAEILIGELDDNGFFAGSVPDIVMVSGESERKIRAVLGEIRKLDPLGCGATTVEECLLAQLDKLDGSPYREEVREILTRGHLKDIAAGRREAVEADLGMSDERYDDVLAALRTLEPRPGRAYVRAGKSVTYVNPEVHARLVDGRWVARVDDRSLPDIRISARYLKMLEDPKLPPETKAAGDDHEHRAGDLRRAAGLFREGAEGAEAADDARGGGAGGRPSRHRLAHGERQVRLDAEGHGGAPEVLQPGVRDGGRRRGVEGRGGGEDPRAHRRRGQGGAALGREDRPGACGGGVEGRAPHGRQIPPEAGPPRHRRTGRWGRCGQINPHVRTGIWYNVRYRTGVRPDISTIRKRSQYERRSENHGRNHGQRVGPGG